MMPVKVETSPPSSKPALNARQAAVLAYVEANPGRSTPSVAAALGLTTSLAHYALNGLYTRRLVGRQMPLGARVNACHWYPATTEQGR